MCQVHQPSCIEILQTCASQSISLFGKLQHRGSPHVHGLTCFQNAPKFHIKTDEERSSYIDQIITCPSNSDNMKSSTLMLKDIDIQRHVSRKYAVKYVMFGGPWPPMSKTQIIRPFDGEELLHVEQYKTIYAQILELFGKLGPTEYNMTFGEFLTKTLYK